MKTWMIPLLLVIFGLSVQAAAYENPLSRATVGEWIEHKRVMSMGGGRAMEQTVKQTVVAKDEKEVTLKVETTMMGKTLPPMEMKIPLDVPYNPVGAGKDSKAKMEIINEGNDTISVGGNTYTCKKIEMKGTSEVKGEEVEVEIKYWGSKDVPVNGVVKMEMTTTKGIKILTELIGAGTTAGK